MCLFQNATQIIQFHSLTIDLKFIFGIFKKKRKTNEEGKEIENLKNNFLGIFRQRIHNITR